MALTQMVSFDQCLLKALLRLVPVAAVFRLATDKRQKKSSDKIEMYRTSDVRTMKLYTTSGNNSENKSVCVCVCVVCAYLIM